MELDILTATLVIKALSVFFFGVAVGVYFERRANLKTRIRSISKDERGEQSSDIESY